MTSSRFLFSDLSCFFGFIGRVRPVIPSAICSLSSSQQDGEMKSRPWSRNFYPEIPKSRWRSREKRRFLPSAFERDRQRPAVPHTFPGLLILTLPTITSACLQVTQRSSSSFLHIARFSSSALTLYCTHLLPKMADSDADIMAMLEKEGKEYDKVRTDDCTRCAKLTIARMPRLIVY